MPFAIWVTVKRLRLQREMTQRELAGASGLDIRYIGGAAEVDIGKGIQKFIRFGEEGCSGSGRKTVGGVLP